MIKLTLVMEEREAEALLAVMRNISGSPDGPRGFTDKITDALIASGVATCSEEYLNGGFIMFKHRWPNGKSKVSVKCERI